MFESAESVVVLGTGTGVAEAGRQIVWVAVCMESGVVATGASSAVGAALDVWVAGEVEAGLGSWTGAEAEFGLGSWAVVETEVGLGSWTEAAFGLGSWVEFEVEFGKGIWAGFEAASEQGF